MSSCWAGAAFALGVILMGVGWVAWVLTNGIVWGTLWWLICVGIGAALGWWLDHRGWHPVSRWLYGQRDKP